MKVGGHYNMDVEAGIKSGLNVKTRIETLYFFLYEMADAFGVDNRALDTIKKGVLDRQVVRKIIINYPNSSDEVIGRVVIDIDWEKHKFLASTDQGSLFRLDPQKTIRSQISDLSEIIISHVNKLRAEYRVKYITTNYRYIKEIEYDSAKNREVMKYLGHVYGDHQAEKIQPVFNQTLSWMIDKLSEVTVTVANK